MTKNLDFENWDLGFIWNLGFGYWDFRAMHGSDSS